MSHRVELAPIAGLERNLLLRTHDPAVDLVSRTLHETGAWEPFETRLWLASHGLDSVVVDVGANLGYFSLLSDQCLRGRGEVFAFEPAADNFALLRENLALNQCGAHTHAVPAALGEGNGQIELYRNDDNRGDHQIYAGDGERSSESIRVLNGAEYLGALVDRIDLLKVDTQGSEYAVLQGLLPLLQQSRATLRLLLELTPYSLEIAGARGRDLIALVASLDLPLFIVDHIEHRLVPSDAQALATWCDNVAATPGDRGFMNIFAGSAPPL